MTRAGTIGLMIVLATGLFVQPEPPAMRSEFAGFPPARGDYKCVILDVIDGDSVKVGLIVPIKIRLHGCNAIELKQPGGPEAKGGLAKILDRPVPLSEVRLYEADKFHGRYVGDFQTEQGFWASKRMIERGLAAPWDGKGKRPTKEDLQPEE